MIDEVREVLSGDERLAFALIFGSQARGTSHAQSDLDVAVGVAPGVRLPTADLGRLVSLLESRTGKVVDLVVVSECSIPLRYAIFRDGVDVLVRDRPELVRQKARAIVDWLDFEPTHAIMVAGALRAARGGGSEATGTVTPVRDGAH